MAVNIETMLRHAEKHFGLDFISNVIVTYKPKDPNDTVTNYIENIDGMVTFYNRYKNTLRKYYVTVFYFDNNDSEIHTIDFGILEGHNILSKLEKTDFFKSTNMWFIAVSHDDFKEYRNANTWHSFYMYIS